MGNSVESKYWVGFDLGGTKMLATVFSEGFEILAQEKAKTKAQQGSDVVLDRIIKAITKACETAAVQPSDIKGIGVGCPGPLDLNKGVILTAPNLGWENVKLKATLEKAFGCPTVIANDVDAGLYGEYHFGAARKARCALGVFPGTGIGGACVYEGHLIRGKVNSCFEIGHIQVQPEGRLCGCGRRGCLETVASRLAIAAEAAKAAFRGEAPHLLEEAGTDLSKIKSNALARSIQAGDTAIENIVRTAARRLGVAVAGVVNLLAPDVVVLGGGLVEAMPDLFAGEVKEAIDAQAMETFSQAVKVVPAKLGDDAVVMGAAALADDMVEEAAESS